MDKLAKRLRDDADQIDVLISPQLENRIEASLRGISQDGVAPAKSRQTASFWWASSLTGVAATLAVISIVNLTGPEPEIAITEPPAQAFSMPQFEWKSQPAILTETLEEELENIQSDLKKAEQAVKEDFEDVL